MNTPESGNLPGRQVFWRTPDGRAEIIRYCDGVFGLEYDGVDVMPTQSFEKVCHYLWAEFMPE